VNQLARLVVLAAITVVVSACGGHSYGGGGSNTTYTPPPQVASGVFKDANVEGLDFSSGGQSGETGADGGFTYEVGEPVTFSVGSVVLGTTDGAPVITPVDLVAGGTSATRAVQNLVRFLLMLDADGDPSNGIQISEAVRTHAETWNQIDFDIDDFNGDPDVLFMQADAQAADLGTHEIPDLLTAQEHLEGTLLCVLTGAYVGTYSGSDSGLLVALIDPTGAINGAGVSASTELLFTFTGGFADPAGDGSVLLGTTASGAVFDGSFDTPDDISGTWAGELNGDTGTFSVSRFANADDAVYRFIGAFEASEISAEYDAGFMLFDIDAANQLAGVAYTIVFDESVDVTGSISEGVLTAMTADGTTIEGVIDLGLLATSGTWDDGVGNFGTFEGLGCQLN